MQIRFCAEINIITQKSEELALGVITVTEEPSVDTLGGAAIRPIVKRQVPNQTEASGMDFFFISSP